MVIWEEGDTWETLVQLVGADPKALQRFSQGVSLGPDAVLDIVNFNNNRGSDPRLDVEWTEQDEENYRGHEASAE